MSNDTSFMNTTVFFTAASFAFVFILNDLLFSSFELNPYVSLVFLPSGVRILFVLVFEKFGAIGIVLGSLLVSLFYLGQTELLSVLLISLVAGFAALAARRVSLGTLGVSEDLLGISFAKLVQLCLVFSFISSISHQALFLLLAINGDFLQQSLYMFVGDVTGALLCLTAARLTVPMLRRRQSI